MSIDETVASIASARRSGTRLISYPETPPSNLAQAYEMQDQMAEAIGKPIIGWKVGFTSTAARDAAGISEPLSGPIFQGSVHADGSRVKVSMDNLKIIEAEIGFSMREDLPPRESGYDRAAVLAAVKTVHPIFELANKRLPGTIKESPEWLVADGSLNECIVAGDGVAMTGEDRLETERLFLQIDDKHASDGIGTNAMGDPVAVLVWLANHLGSRGITLKAGDLVATGLLCDLIYGEVGSSYTAEFQSIGSVSMTLAIRPN